MQHLYQPAIFVQPVIDARWRMQNLANAWSLRDWHANSRQALEQLDMVNKGSTEPLGFSALM
jgi:hypothetical protein